MFHNQHNNKNYKTTTTTKKNIRNGQHKLWQKTVYKNSLE